MRRPFMTRPDQLASLEGQQYLVLRPGGAVSEEYRSMQGPLVAALPPTVTHPHTEHATLRGFFEPERHDAVAAVIREWAAQQHPIEIVAEAVDTFPAPWQIVIMRLARTPSLVHAYASLTELLAATDLRRLDERPLEEWTFHLSVVYGKTLPADVWADLDGTVRRTLTPPLRTTVTEAELITYTGGVEHAEVIPLG